MALGSLPSVALSSTQAKMSVDDRKSQRLSAEAIEEKGVEKATEWCKGVGNFRAAKWGLFRFFVKVCEGWEHGTCWGNVVSLHGAVLTPQGDRHSQALPVPSTAGLFGQGQLIPLPYRSVHPHSQSHQRILSRVPPPL